MLGGWALVEAFHAGWRYRAAGAASLILFLPPSIAYATDNIDYDYRWSIAARNLLSGVSQIRLQHPNKTILLTNVPQELFYVAVYHQAFRVVSLYDVYLTPDHANIDRMSGYEPIDRFFLSRDETLRVLSLGRAVVYDAGGSRLVAVPGRDRRRPGRGAASCGPSCPAKPRRSWWCATTTRRSWRRAGRRP
jgi:hypothetical protein